MFDEIKRRLHRVSSLLCPLSTANMGCDNLAALAFKVSGCLGRIIEQNGYLLGYRRANQVIESYWSSSPNANNSNNAWNVNFNNGNDNNNNRTNNNHVRLVR